MANILISFLGTGPSSEDGTGKRNYREAKYTINNKEYTSSFVSKVLYQELEIDRIILIGTMKSMWEEVYLKFSDLLNYEVDEDFYFELANITEKSNHKTTLTSSPFNRLEEIFNNNSKIGIIHYGINESELWNNFSIITQLMETIEDGDNVHLDITHSFRSLSIFSMTSILYLDDVLDKDFTLEGIYYGMIDIIREMGVAPIINLSIIPKLLRTIKAANNFSNYGNGFLMAELLGQESNYESKIYNFSQATRINYLNEIKNQINSLKNINWDNIKNPALKLIIPKTVQNFVSRFSSNDPNYIFQIKMAEWYLDKKNYALSYIALVESILSYIAYKEGIGDSRSEEENKRVKSKLFKNNKYKDLKKLYFDTNEIRNCIAHQLDKRTNTYKNDINNLEKRILKAKRLFTP